MQELIGIIKEIDDEAAHIIGTEADYHEEVAIQDAKEIQRLCKKALKLLTSE